MMQQNSTICPRCHLPTIRTKDMGKSGTLFVHADRIESGIPVQDACRVSVDELANGVAWQHPQHTEE